MCAAILIRSSPLQIYLINLDRSPHRLAHMRGRLDSLNISFQRIAAVDGATIQSEGDGARPLSAGEVGCLLSHRIAWERIAAGGGFGAVLEDDLHVSADLHRFLGHSQWIPQGTDIVTFESGRRPVALVDTGLQYGGRTLATLASTHSGAGGYIVSAEMAGRLLNLSEQLDRPADAVLFDLPRGAPRASHVLQVNPALCIQDSFLPAEDQDRRLASTLDVDRQRTRRSVVRLFSRIARELAYPFKKARQKAEVQKGAGGKSVSWTKVPYADRNS